MRSAGGGQAEVRIQPRQALRLRAGRDRADRDSRRLSNGLRGHGRQHLGQDDAAGFSGQDRGAIRQRQTHLGDGSRHPDRGGPGGDASLADAHPLSRGHAARTADQAGKGACGQAVGRRARERAGQVDRTGAGDLRLRPQPSPAREGTGDAAASVAQADQTPARTARAEPDARRAVAEARRSQKGGRQGLRVADDPYADEGSAGHPANVPFRAGPQEASHRPAARRRLSASLQHQGRRSRPSLAALSPTGRDRASVQGTEERSVDSAHPSPARGPHRSPYLRGVPRLRPDGDAETTAEGAGAGTDAPSRARKTRRHPDDRRRAAYDGRPHGRPGPPYRAGKRPPTPAATPGARPPRPAPTKNHGPAPPPGRLNPHSLCSADLWTRARAIPKASPRQNPPVGEVGLDERRPRARHHRPAPHSRGNERSPDVDLGGERAMNGALLGNLEQPSTLSLVQRSDQLDVQLDPIEHRIYVFAIDAILSVNPLVSQPNDDLFEQPFPPRGVQIDSYRRATAERHQQQFVRAGSSVSASSRYWLVGIQTVASIQHDLLE